MPSFQFNLDPKKRAAARFITAVRIELQKALAEEEKAGRLNKSRVAERLDIHRSAVTRRLKGTDGLTLRSLAEMAWAMDRIVEVTLHPIRTPPGRNEPFAFSPDHLRPMFERGTNAKATTANVDNPVKVAL